MTIEEMKRRKKELGYTNEMIAEKSGIPLGTVQKVFSGATENPRYGTLQKLSSVFNNTYDAGSAKGHAVKETAAHYSAGKKVIVNRKTYIDDVNLKDWSRQGEYTLEDCYSLPDDINVELIDGVIYNMTSPKLSHQSIVLEMGAQLRQCIKKHSMPCKVYISPVDVRLDMDDRTMVVPDVVLICHENETDNHIEGAPEFVAEVLSQSTRRKDCTVKLEKYQSAGVKEYWIVDPENKKVLVYDFENEKYPQMFSFTEKIPVGISSGKCKIDFSEIANSL